MYAILFFERVTARMHHNSEMKNAVENYFGAERQQSTIFFFAGAVALLVGLVGWFIKHDVPMFLGASGPLVVVGAIHLALGAGIYFRTPQDLARVNTKMLRQPHEAAREELPRMRQVIGNFPLYRKISIALTGVGILMVAASASIGAWLGYWCGFGAALMLMAGITLALDLSAERRARVYLKAMEDVATQSVLHHRPSGRKRRM
jgi:hypothetical protein